MTEAQPQPAGDPVRAFRTALRRAHKAERTVRELRAEISLLRAAQDHLEDRE